MQVPEEQMDVDDFYKWADSKGKTPEWAKATWKQMDETCNPSEREGSGPTLKLWVKLNKKRVRVDQQFIENSYGEGFNTGKNPDTATRDMLKDFASQSAPTHSDAFFQDEAANTMDQEKRATDVTHADRDSKANNNKLVLGGRIDVATAGPKYYSKFEKQIKPMTDIHAKVREAARIQYTFIIEIRTPPGKTQIRNRK